MNLKKLSFNLLSILVVFLSCSYSYYQNTRLNNIDPTGSYDLLSKARIIKGDIYGRTGSMQIKVLSKNIIVVVMEVNNGAKAYNSGIFIDTMIYKNNSCMSNSMQYDPSCKIIFKFKSRGVVVTQKQDDLNSGCGFGHGVFADGFYKKVSSKTPVLTNPQTGEIIK